MTMTAYGEVLRQYTNRTDVSADELAKLSEERGYPFAVEDMHDRLYQQHDVNMVRGPVEALELDNKAMGRLAVADSTVCGDLPWVSACSVTPYSAVVKRDIRKDSVPFERLSDTSSQKQLFRALGREPRSIGSLEFSTSFQPGVLVEKYSSVCVVLANIILADCTPGTTRQGMPPC